MILLWCLLAIAVAFGIGRYHQSNKLFWSLFTSFVIGIAGAAVYNKIVTTEQSEVRSTQVLPTQVTSTTNGNVTIAVEDAMYQESALVSQAETPECKRSEVVRTLWVKAVPTVPPRIL